MTGPWTGHVRFAILFPLLISAGRFRRSYSMRFSGTGHWPRPVRLRRCFSKSAWNLFDRLTGSSPLSPHGSSPPPLRDGRGWPIISRSRSCQPVQPCVSLRDGGEGKEDVDADQAPENSVQPATAQRWRDEPKAKGGWAVSREGKVPRTEAPRPACGQKCRHVTAFLGAVRGQIFGTKIWAWKARTDVLFRLPGRPGRDA